MQINSTIPLIFGVPDVSFYDAFNAKKAFVAELRPGLEGTKGVAARLLKKGVQPVIICDNMIAFCMKKGLVSEAYIFYQARDKKNLVCRTGSFIVALSAKVHHVPLRLHSAKSAVKRPGLLSKINGIKVTTATIKTYVPATEEVPLALTQ